MQRALTSRQPKGIAGRLRRYGAVAQLVERLVRNEEVRGSIPLSSTIRRARRCGVFAPPVPLIRYQDLVGEVQRPQPVRGMALARLARSRDGPIQMSDAPPSAALIVPRGIPAHNVPAEPEPLSPVAAARRTLKREIKSEVLVNVLAVHHPLLSRRGKGSKRRLTYLTHQLASPAYRRARSKTRPRRWLQRGHGTDRSHLLH